MDQLIVNFLLITIKIVIVICVFVIARISTKSESKKALLSNLEIIKKENNKGNAFTIASLVMMLITLFFETFNKKYYVSLRILYAFSIISLIVVMTAFLYELAEKSEDIYTRSYLVAIFYYIEASSFFIIIIQYFLRFNQSNLIRFRVSLEDFLFLIIQLVLTILMFIGWLMFYSLAKMKKNNIKTIDLIELKNIFLKSTLQSLTTVIALYGLTSWNITTTFQLLVFFIDAFAAFSYPILDINKYVHEKEIVYSKNYAPIRPIAESKE